MAAEMLQIPFGHTTVRRIAPAMPAHAYKTFGLAMPVRTHFRPATCDEAGCEAYKYGWVSTFDLGTDLGQAQYEHCKADRTRSFSIQRASLTLVKFTYPPGNRCFRAGDHRVPLERPARFYVADGDFRGNPRGTPVRVHSHAEHWCEEFAEHQDRLSTAIERG